MFWLKRNESTKLGKNGKYAFKLNKSSLTTTIYIFFDLDLKLSYNLSYIVLSEIIIAKHINNSYHKNFKTNYLLPRNIKIIAINISPYTCCRYIGYNLSSTNNAMNNQISCTESDKNNNN